MGKNYRKELDGLHNVHHSAMKADINMLTGFLSKYRTYPFFAIGSGGSYCAAAAFEFLSVKTGLLAQKITPLELGQLQYQLHNSAAILFTAGGSNHDSKNAYRYITEHEPEGVLTCCMRFNAPIKKLQKTDVHNYYYEYKMPVAKDGYLAVESLMSLIILMIRAFHEMTRDDYFLLPEYRVWDSRGLNLDTIKSVMERESIFILYGGITMPAAIDLESKFSEVSLGNTQLVDFRNFAHGRHYWMSDRRKETAVIALVGKSEKKLADSTLKLLPKDIPVLRIDVEDDTAKGLVDALHYSFEIVGQAALLRNFDPGKPHVEEFGKKLYHLNYDIGKKECMAKRRKDMFAMAAYRKAAKHQGIGISEYQKHSHIYWDTLVSRAYKGIIFDYDGTLHDKDQASNVEERLFAKLNILLDRQIIIGIATGRGKSARIELQKKIERKYWKNVWIAYYNGGVIGTLDDDTKPNKQAAEMPMAFHDIISKLSDCACAIEENPYQLTLLKDELNISSAEFAFLKEQILERTDIKVMETNHSIDIIPAKSSKRNIFLACKYAEEEFLTIGDSGYLGGNDYELLHGDSSLSVDYVSDAFHSCWNYAKPGMRNLEATEYYLNMIDIRKEGTFCLKG